MATERFTVFHRSPLDDEDEVPAAKAGVIAIDESHHIEIVSATPEYEETLELAAEMLNASDDFLVRAPSPDRTTKAVYKRAVPRDAEGARDALCAALRQKYGFELGPAA